MSPVFEWLDQLDSYRCAAIDVALLKLGIAFSARYRLSYWDGAMMAAAETLGARVIYTEDLGHGQVYGTVRCENPFEDDWSAPKTALGPIIALSFTTYRAKDPRSDNR